jgi:hypothetical protein
MQPVRLIREVRQPGGCGPFNGQYALQKALRAAAPPWLHLGGMLRRGELPWFWCWEDRDAAAACGLTGEPFVVGPNILFQDSRFPGRLAGERHICQAASCRLMFTESAWYRELIETQRGPLSRAPIVLWPYPIDPRPGPPLPAQCDLLIYAKGRYRQGLVARLLRRVARAVLVVYGQYRREELFELARRARCCLYLSDDDRGPLALAEILLAGCPAIGIARGAPFVRHGETGVLLQDFAPQACLDAVARCQELRREQVAALAAAEFDTGRIVRIVLKALEAAAFRDGY